MEQYILFIGLLTAVYFGYVIVRTKEKKRMRRYYGYTRQHKAKQVIRKAA